MSLKTHLKLGRVSNLPTVWTNVLAAAAIGGVSLFSPGWLALLLAMSLLYTAGMYYNDVCDVEHDRVHQAWRPIPTGLISTERAEAFALAYVMLALLLIYAARMSAPLAKGTGSSAWLLSSLSLIGLIILYNRHHKGNRFSPLLMAACRAAVLLTASYTLTGTISAMLILAIFAILSWLVGLTWIAKREKQISISNRTLQRHWPLALLLVPVALAFVLSSKSSAILIPLCALLFVIKQSVSRLAEESAERNGSAVAMLIAGISLVDGVFLAMNWGVPGAVIALAAFLTTLMLQRWIAGT